MTRGSVYSMRTQRHALTRNADSTARASAPVSPVGHGDGAAGQHGVAQAGDSRIQSQARRSDHGRFRSSPRRDPEDARHLTRHLVRDSIATPILFCGQFKMLSSRPTPRRTRAAAARSMSNTRIAGHGQTDEKQGSVRSEVKGTRNWTAFVVQILYRRRPAPLATDAGAPTPSTNAA